MTMTSSTARPRARLRLPNPDVMKLVLGVLIVLAVLYGQQVVGILTRTTRIDPAIPRDGLVNVVAVVGFEPERFHNERLATYGMFSGRDGSLRRIRLRQVSQDQLQGLASLPWIDRVELLK